MQDAPRITVEEVRRKLASGQEDLLLVCAYRDKEKCAGIAIDGSIPLQELESTVDDLPRESTIVFY